MNIGHSSRLPYDECTYPDKLRESMSPHDYRTSVHQIHNCNRCVSVNGPRSGVNGHGVSTSLPTKHAPAQELVELDSIMSNRDVKLSKCKRGKVNHTDLSKFTSHSSPECSPKLNMSNTRYTHPSMSYRGTGLNRFYDLIHDPQENIFWDSAASTRLEAKDNFKHVMAKPWDESAIHPKGK